MRTPDWFHDEHEDREIEALALKIGSKKALQQLDKLSQHIETGWGERDIQNYLIEHPHLLLGRHRTGHCTYALPEVQLGNQYRIDWAVANGSSGGIHWELIELETPLKSPFKRNGHFSAAAYKGIEQIEDWRFWTRSNPDYAQRPKAANGLGLYEINCNHGLVVVGCRAHYDNAPGRNRYNAIRQATRQDKLIELVSYESFIESLRFRFSISPRQ